MLWVEIIGWVGSTLYLVSYFLLAYKLINKSKFYYMLNTVAGILAAILSIYKETWQTVFLNLFWVFISIFAYYNRWLNLSIVSPRIFNISIGLIICISMIVVLFEKHDLGIDILAWSSVYLFIISFYLISMRKISLQVFNLYNFIAAIMIIPKMFVYQNYQVASVQIIWALIAINAYYRDKKRVKNEYF